MPPSWSYVPLGTYSEDKVGGMLQEASLWPWVAGIVSHGSGGPREMAEIPSMIVF